MHLSHKLAVRMAGPGSGKTRTVVHRCAYLLRVERVRSRGILVCCFNRRAALELRRRLVDLVGADARGVMILTYHGLALRLLGRSLSSTRGSAVPDLDALIPEDINLGYPALFAADHPLHAALGRLHPGDRLTLQAEDWGLLLSDLSGMKVARLSRSAAFEWQKRLPAVREARVVAMITRHVEQDDDAERRQRCRVGEWEVPLVEIVAKPTAEPPQGESPR